MLAAAFAAAAPSDALLRRCLEIAGARDASRAAELAAALSAVDRAILARIPARPRRDAGEARARRARPDPPPPARSN